MFRYLALTFLLFSAVRAHASPLQVLERDLVGSRGQVSVPSRYISRNLGNGVSQLRQAPDLIANLRSLDRLSKLECKKEQPTSTSVESAHCHFSLEMKKQDGAAVVYPSGLLSEMDDCASCGLQTEVLFTENGRDWFVVETGGFEIEGVQFDSFVDGRSIIISSRVTQSGGGPLTITVVTTNSEGTHLVHAKTIDPDLD